MLEKDHSIAIRKQPWDRLQFPELEVVLRIESLFAGSFASIKL